MDMTKKQEWVTALRSGTYRQTEGVLRYKDRHCVAGVLCDIIEPNGWEDQGEEGFYVWNYKGRKRIASLSVETLDELGLTWKQVRQLQHLNDQTNGRTFVELADYIEAHF